MRVSRGELSPREYAPKDARLIELPHLDRVLERLTFAADARRRGLTLERHDLKVQIRRETPVQPELFLARQAALLERGEIQKTQIKRLLQLVRVRPGQEHIGDVRFDVLDLAHRMGVA